MDRFDSMATGVLPVRRLLTLLAALAAAILATLALTAGLSSPAEARPGGAADELLTRLIALEAQVNGLETTVDE
jgi:hypothetical protein